MAEKGIVIVHDEQRKPMENEKDRDEETHNLKEEHIAYVLELEKTVNDKDRLVITLREEAHAIKIRSEAEISKLKQQLSEEKRSKNVVATSVGSASEIRDYKEHSKKQSQVIHDLKQEIKEFKSHLESGMESYHRQIEEIEEERDKLREDFASSRAELKTKDETMEKLLHELVMVKKEAFESQQLIEKLKEDLETERAKAEVFKADFKEERRDREKAQGALDELRKQLGGHKSVVNEEVAALNKEVLLYKEQAQKLNAKNVKLAKEGESFSQVILQMKKQVEQSTRELSEQKRVYNEEAKKLREDLQKKKKEIELLEKESKRSTTSMVQQDNKIEKLEEEIKEERRMRKNAEERIRILDEKSKTTRQISATQQFSSVPEQTLVHVQQQYDESIAHTLELNRKIEELEEEVTRLNESACGHHSNKYVIGIVHDEQHKPINQENEKDRDEETHNLREECIAYEEYILELEKPVNEKDQLFITLHEEARANKMQFEAEILKLKQQLSDEKRPKNLLREAAVTSVGSASEIKDYREHGKKTDQTITDLSQKIKVLETLGRDLMTVKKESQQLIERWNRDVESERAKAEVFIAKFEGEHRQVTKLLSEVLKRLRSPEEDSQIAVDTMASQTSSRPSDGESHHQSKAKRTAVKSTDGSLVDINNDSDIAKMALEVMEEVSKDRKLRKTDEFKPYDPNLVCPMCGKGHRIGDIQKFRHHVDHCNGNDPI